MVRDYYKASGKTITYKATLVAIDNISPKQFLDNNPARIGFLLSSDRNQSLWVSPSPNVPLATGTYISAGNNPTLFHGQQYGLVVGEPWYASATAAMTIYVIEIISLDSIEVP